MTDTSHLAALQTKLSHERSRLAADGSEIRKVWIAQIEREIANEEKFLDIEPAAALPQMTVNIRKHLQGPKAGTRWFRPNNRGYGFVISHSAETRHVIDRTLGGDVLFVSGRFSRFAYQQRCTLEEWLNWQHDAKQVTP